MFAKDALNGNDLCRSDESGFQPVLGWVVGKGGRQVPVTGFDSSVDAVWRVSGVETQADEFIRWMIRAFRKALR